MKLRLVRPDELPETAKYVNPEYDDEEIEIHIHCGDAVDRMGEDGISVCPSCGICEGETKFVSIGEYESAQNGGGD